MICYVEVGFILCSVYIKFYFLVENGYWNYFKILFLIVLFLMNCREFLWVIYWLYSMKRCYILYIYVCYISNSIGMFMFKKILIILEFDLV